MAPKISTTLKRKAGSGDIKRTSTEVDAPIITDSILNGECKVDKNDNLSTDNITEDFFRKLPRDIFIELLRHLGPAESTSFGLTCKVFYAIHRGVYGSVPLSTSSKYLLRGWDGEIFYPHLGFLLNRHELGHPLNWAPDFVTLWRGEERKRMRKMVRWRNFGRG